MKITFFCKVDKRALSIVEFYKQDIEILKRLGYDVRIATKYNEIDWSSEILFIWWWTYAFYPIFRAKLFRKKTIITGTFNYRAPESPIDYFRRPLWQRILIKYSICNASHNILVSQKELTQIKNDWQLTNVSYSPHIVDTDKYIPLKQMEKKSDFIFTMIWTGKLNLVRKCLPEIVESAKNVLSKYSDIKFIIAGRKGDGFEYAKSLIDEAGLLNNILLIGEISEQEKIKYMQECLIYLQPSRYEGFGVAIAEAMACGAPVITSNAGEVINVIGDAGVLLKGYRPEEISESVLSLLNNDEYRKELKAKSRQRILDNFSLKVRRDDIKRIIDELQ